MSGSKPVLVTPTRGTVSLSDAWASPAEFMKLMGGNTGNLAFLSACLLTIDGLVRPDARPLRDASTFVWACANFIAEHRAIAAPTGPAFDLQTPTVAIGLGAQAPSGDRIIDVPDQSREWIAAIAERSVPGQPNITVRGTYSLQVLESIGLGDHAIALGCPSLFLSPSPHLGADIAAALEATDGPGAFGVCPGNLQDTRERHMLLESFLWNLMTESGADYLIQHPVDIVALASNEDHDLTDFQIKTIAAAVAPELSTEEFIRELRQRARIFPEAVSWIFALRRLNLVASARFHGAQLALQSGTPALCVTIDHRQREMCDIMQIPSIDYTETDALTWEIVRQRLRNHDWASFDANRRELAHRFRDFLVANKLTPSPHLTGICEPDLAGATP